MGHILRQKGDLIAVIGNQHWLFLSPNHPCQTPKGSYSEIYYCETPRQVPVTRL